MKNHSAWTNDMLQSIVYWVAYKKTIFPFYQIPEGAIASELWEILKGLMNSQNEKYRIYPEYQYSKISENESNKDRADIAICRKVNDTEELEAIIEIKKYEDKNQNAITTQIKKDIEKIVNLRKETKNKKFKSYLLIVNQERFPDKFINEKGEVKKRNIDLPENLVKHIKKKESRKCFPSTRYKIIKKGFFAILLTIE